MDPGLPPSLGDIISKLEVKTVSQPLLTLKQENNCFSNYLRGRDRWMLEVEFLSTKTGFLLQVSQCCGSPCLGSKKADPGLNPPFVSHFHNTRWMKEAGCFLLQCLCSRINLFHTVTGYWITHPFLSFCFKVFASHYCCISTGQNLFSMQPSTSKAVISESYNPGTRKQEKRIFMKKWRITSLPEDEVKCFRFKELTKMCLIHNIFLCLLCFE